MSLLTTLILVPLMFALVIALIPRNYRFLIRVIALVAGSLTLANGLLLLWQYDGAAAVAGYKFNQQAAWLPALGISYHVGVDGINLGLVVMGAIVAFAATCASWEIETHVKEYYVLLLVMIGGILGAFSSLDLFFFYFFHELALVPTFIMIGVWGRGERKNYAAFNITLYLSAGALIALIGLIMLYTQAGIRSFDIVTLTAQIAKNPIPVGAQHLIFPMLLFGFGILVSLWPFHTWAPLGYGAAPTATAMLHAGVLKKFGLYGLIRVAIPLLPQGAQSWMHILAFLCLGNLVYCGWVAMRQKDLDLLIGNSSVAHMGFIFLGIASLTLVGVTGAVVVMIAHGLLAALSFGLSGYLYRQTGTLRMADHGGLLQRMPFIGAALVMAFLAGCGVPGFANFAGEVLVLFGAWKSSPMAVTAAAWGALVIGAIYMLRAIRNVVHGPLPERWQALADANAWRKLPFALLLGCLLVLGCWPRVMADRIEPSARVIVELANGRDAFAPQKMITPAKRAPKPKSPAKK